MASLNLFRKLQLVWLAFFDKRTPFAAKVVMIFGLLYGFSPLDLVPDFLPIAGQLDDIGVIITAVMIFLRATKGVREKIFASGKTTL